MQLEEECIVVQFYCLITTIPNTIEVFMASSFPRKVC